jgi:hypothetical protein
VARPESGRSVWIFLARGDFSTESRLVDGFAAWGRGPLAVQQIGEDDPCLAVIELGGADLGGIVHEGLSMKGPPLHVANVVRCPGRLGAGSLA